MFSVYLDLEEAVLEGLEALDRRRALGLPDGANLQFRDNVTLGTGCGGHCSLWSQQQARKT